MMAESNIKNYKYCAFCKYWYDPTNQYIQPVSPAYGMWKYETSAKCMCMKKNHPMEAGFRCSNYVCKV